MKYNLLGHTGLLVSELCLGAMTFGDGQPAGAIGEVPQADADPLVRRVIEAGVNFIDTADIYARGRSEEITGQALRNLGIRRSDIVLASKAYGEMGEGPNDRGASRGHIMDAIEASLRRLNTDYIDLYQIHSFDAVTPVEETMRALDDLVRQGKVRYIGVSNARSWQVVKANAAAEKQGGVRFETLQAYYSVAGRDIERDIVPMLNDQHIGLLVWSPLAGGLLSGKVARDQSAPEGARRANLRFPPVDEDRAFASIDQMRDIARAHQVSVAQVALAWLRQQPHVTSVLIGAKRMDQLDDNLASADLTLTPDELAMLDKVSALAPEYPQWMFDFWVERQRFPNSAPFTAPAS